MKPLFKIYQEQGTVSKLQMSFSISEKNQVSGKSLSKRFVKLQNFFQFLNVDHVDVTVGEGTDVNRGFGYSVIPPAGITKNVTFSEKSQNFPILLE